MTDALLVSNVLLWCLVIVLALVVLALARQVGVLHERVAPAGALMPTTGPKVGEHTQPATYRDLDGSRSPSAARARTAVPRWCCGSRRPARCARRWCPTAVSMARAERLRLVFASDGDKLERHQAYVGDLGIAAYPYVVSQALGHELRGEQAAVRRPDRRRRRAPQQGPREHAGAPRKPGGIDGIGHPLAAGLRRDRESVEHDASLKGQPS